MTRSNPNHERTVRTSKRSTCDKRVRAQKSQKLSETSSGDKSLDLDGNVQKHARPYRSHRYPACTRCHKRRSRCTIEVPGQPCLLCRLSASTCSAVASVRQPSTSTVGFSYESSLTNADMDGYARVLGPVVSRDTHVLEKIVSDINSDSQKPMQADNIPVYRSSQVSRRPSPPSHWSSEELCRQLFQRVDPYIHRLVLLYFEELHPCLPMMDEREIWTRLTRRSSLHSLFLTNLIAYTSFYWNASPALPPEAKPDQDFIWDVAGMTMKDQSQRGDMFAIIAAALNVSGRPSKGVVNNTCQIARITALSHSIGLNHNCVEWDLTRSEKYVRTKLWWVVVIHDRWFHFAQGTPPYISNQHYNVPLPTLSMLTEGRLTSTKHVQAAECFIHLCKLTEIVGDILPLIYHMRSGDDEFAAEKITMAELQIDTWLSESPSWMSLDKFNERPGVPGFANLQLSYLVVGMLLKRMAYHESSIKGGPHNHPRLLECLVAAEAVSSFLNSLNAHELSGFWLPYHAQHFTSAVTLLLRCALQMDTACSRKRAMESASGLLECLKICHETHDWDMAETVLPQMESIVCRIRDAVPRAHLEVAAPIDSGQIRSPVVPECDQHDLVDGAVDFSTLEFHNDVALEAMFPELFAGFTDNAFFDQ